MDTSTAKRLRGRKILVTEDDLFMAMDVADALQAAGASVIGPVGSTDRAIRLCKHRRPDAAVLDIGLGAELVFPLADELASQSVPFVFASGCDREIIPEKFAQIPFCEKPLGPHELVGVLSELMELPSRG